MSIEQEVLKWFASGDTGISSEAMAMTACGITPKRSYTPSDPSDFNRCLKLVIAVPEIKNHFDKISALSPQWANLIGRWDEVEKCFIDEVGIDWSKDRAKPARKTYDLMKEIGC